ncbi:unnamed protein product [Arctia plantaginis]|uniref:Uncharacterized protein n=1 Tax=Arctia plantaginis TaxID=874455 RepID=A0A8S1ARW5_ARCPL|nr:unnamed protein product [Arctia plantaginis]
MIQPDAHPALALLVKEVTHPTLTVLGRARRQARARPLPPAPRRPAPQDDTAPTRTPRSPCSLKVTYLYPTLTVLVRGDTPYTHCTRPRSPPSARSAATACAPPARATR